MGHALCRRRAVMGVIAMAGLLGAWGPASLPALAQEAPIDDLLVAPPGTTLEVLNPAAGEYDGMSFIENFDRDITVAAEARAALRVDGSPKLLVTAVRLSSAREAADALAAIGESIAAQDMPSNPKMDEVWAGLGMPDPYIEALPQSRRDVVVRQIVMSEDYRPVEMAWASGQDVIVVADLDRDNPGVVPPIMYEALDAHRAASPT